MPPAYQNDEPHKLGVGTLPTLAGNDVPLLRGADNDLSGTDLLLAQLVVASQFCNSNAVCGQALVEEKQVRQECFQGALAPNCLRSLSTGHWQEVQPNRETAGELDRPKNKYKFTLGQTKPRLSGSSAHKGEMEMCRSQDLF